MWGDNGMMDNVARSVRPYFGHGHWGKQHTAIQKKARVVVQYQPTRSALFLNVGGPRMLLACCSATKMRFGKRFLRAEKEKSFSLISIRQRYSLKHTFSGYKRQCKKAFAPISFVSYFVLLCGRLHSYRIFPSK